MYPSLFPLSVDIFVVHYESIKRELNKRLIFVDLLSSFFSFGGGLHRFSKLGDPTYALIHMSGGFQVPTTYPYSHIPDPRTEVVLFQPKSFGTTEMIRWGQPKSKTEFSVFFSLDGT